MTAATSGSRAAVDREAVRPLRVAMVIQRFRPAFSGQGEQLELLCRVLTKRGVQPTIVTPSAQEGIEEQEGYQVVRLTPRFPGGATLGLGARARGPAFAYRTLGCLQQHGPFDLVHVHALTDALYASWLWCRWHDVPLIFEMTLVGADDASSVLAARQRGAVLRRAIFRRCDGYVAISPALMDRYHAAGLPPGKVRLLSQGVDTAQFRPAADRMARRRELGLPTTGPIVMMVGSLIHRKGLDVLLRAWTEIGREMPDAHLILVGRNRFPADAAATAFLEEQLALLTPDVATRVHQLGVRQDVSRLLQAADVFVFPSREEGFGTVMIEAMACALPCIVTQLPGITDFIFGTAAQDCGIVVPQQDHMALAAAVQHALADPGHAAAIGQRARRQAVERFEITGIADRYVRYYNELIQRGTSVPGV